MTPALPDPLPITPFTQPVRGEVTLPGSKSITNRALLLAALCEQPVTLAGSLFSEDTELMAEALRRLGFSVEADPRARTLRVSNQTQGFTAGETEIFVGLAGTAARFLTAFCAAAPRGIYRIDGVPQMRQRPMKGLIDSLRQLGANIRCMGEEGFFPIEIRAQGLRGGPVTIDASESSQLLSALLMVAPLTATPSIIKLAGAVRWPFVNVTLRMQQHFGITPRRDAKDDVIIVPLGHYQSPGLYTIEPDATAASYFLALPIAARGILFFPGLFSFPGELQGDAQFVEVLKRVGAKLEGKKGPESIPSPAQPEPNPNRPLHPGIESSYDGRNPLRGVEQNFSLFSDTFLTLAALAPLLQGRTKITGIAHTRKQETDRVAGMVRELRKLGQEVVEHEDGDGLTITPRPLQPGVEIETYGDHRFAMSFGILGCHPLQGDKAWLKIRNPGCCAKTFPNFFQLLADLQKKSAGK